MSDLPCAMEFWKLFPMNWEAPSVLRRSSSLQTSCKSPQHPTSKGLPLEVGFFFLIYAILVGELTFGINSPRVRSQF
jgi:hypothetical protein